MFAALSTRELTDLRTAIDSEIASRQTQLAVLTETLESLLAANASDAVIEHVMAAIDILDAATPNTPDVVEPEPLQDDSDDIQPDLDDDRKRVIAELRAAGYVAPGLDALITLYHRDVAEQDYERAENDTRGQMICPKYRGTDYSPRRLWFCNTRELHKYASEELLRWFDENRRVTRAMLRDQLFNRSHYAGGGYFT